MPTQEPKKLNSEESATVNALAAFYSNGTPIQWQYPHDANPTWRNYTGNGLTALAIVRTKGILRVTPPLPVKRPTRWDELDFSKTIWISYPGSCPAAVVNTDITAGSGGRVSTLTIEGTLMQFKDHYLECLAVGGYFYSYENKTDLSSDMLKTGKIPEGWFPFMVTEPGKEEDQDLP